MPTKPTLLILTLLLTTLTACTNTRALFDTPSYTEKLSSLYMTEDAGSFVIFTESYHYIFKMPVNLASSLNSDYAKILSARFNVFHVAEDNSISGEVVLMIPVSTATKQQLDDAYKNGFTQTHKYWLTNKLNLSGTRYQSNGINPALSEKQFNGNYNIKITEEQTIGGALLKIPQTPIAIVKDVVQLGTGALVLIVMALSG